MTTLLRGGTIITGAGQRRADLLLDGEKIAWVGRGPQAADREVDVSGCFLFPGFIDAHTHFDLDVANTTTADDFCTGSRAALRGGTTTVIDFACPNKGESLHHGLDLWHQKADGRTFCDYGFHMTIDDWNESIRARPARPGQRFFLEVAHVSRHDVRRPGHLLGTEGAEAAGGHRRLPLRERRCH